LIVAAQQWIATETRKHGIILNMDTLIETNLPLREETDIIIGLAIEVHKILGPGFLEIVYKDALEYEFKENNYQFSREEEYIVLYKKVILKHKFYADFVVFNNVIVEIKAKQGGIAQEDLAQTINYLKVSGCKVGLVLNFASSKLQIKRVVF
jgi:GxxExxY protein